MYESVKQNTRTLTGGGDRTIADGISVKMPGKMTFDIIKNLIDEIVLVDDDEITKAMFLLMERMKFVVEPAGAVGLAYLISKKPSPEKKAHSVLSTCGHPTRCILMRPRFITGASYYSIGHPMEHPTDIPWDIPWDIGYPMQS